jgi:hypothetical protein
MLVKVLSIDSSKRIAQVQIGDDTAECRVVYPNNKGAENSAWVEIKHLHTLLGDGEHKNWLTVPRTFTAPVECDTLKKPNLPLYVHINNIKYYVSEEEYKTVKEIFDKATVKLTEARKQAGLK